MQYVHIIMAVLASWRLVEIITIDEISKTFREKHKHYFWTCGRCVSVWTSTLTFILWYFVPLANWPLAISNLTILGSFGFAALIRPKK